VAAPGQCAKRSLCDKPDDKEAKKLEAQKRLNELLAKLKTVSPTRASPDREVVLAKPRRKRPIPRSSSGLPKSTVVQVSNVEPELVEAAQKVVDVVKDPLKKEEVQSDLLQKLKSISSEAKAAKFSDRVEGEEDSPSGAVSSILEDLKIEKTKTKKDEQLVKQRKDLTMEQVEFLEKRKRLRREAGRKQQEDHIPIDLFGEEPFGIFTQPIDKSSQETGVEAGGRQQLRMWRACAQRELRILSTPSPRNALEEMIAWTEQGKLWHFPIDNEQGLDYSNDPFHEHVFLEHHLEPWCPPRGPVRHFMELVCVGLSKNPYITTKKKRDTITWFKDYFERPESFEILDAIGAWDLEASN